MQPIEIVRTKRPIIYIIMPLLIGVLQWVSLGIVAIQYPAIRIIMIMVGITIGLLIAGIMFLEYSIHLLKDINNTLLNHIKKLS